MRRGSRPAPRSSRARPPPVPAPARSTRAQAAPWAAAAVWRSPLASPWEEPSDGRDLRMRFSKMDPAPPRGRQKVEYFGWPTPRKYTQ
jgi:hypothetical protein